MVCHKPGDMSKPVVESGSAEPHLPQDDKDSQDQTTVIKPSLLKTSASAPGGEFKPDSGSTGEDFGINWCIIPATNPKFVFKLEIMGCWLKDASLGVRILKRIYIAVIYKVFYGFLYPLGCSSRKWRNCNGWSFKCFVKVKFCYSKFLTY